MKGNQNLIDIIAKIFNHQSSCRKLEIDHSEAKNVNSELCSKCRGECCKRCGCHFSPSDFKDISFEILKKEIEKGYISIDYVDGDMIFEDFGVYILRTRNANMPIVDTSWNRGTGCILLTDKGCKLKYQDRPSGGKLLIPEAKISEDGEIIERRCRSKYDMDECCQDWKPYQKIIIELTKYFTNKDIPCSL